MAKPEGNRPVEDRAAYRERVGELLSGLMDFEFREMLTPRVVPSLYLLSIALAVLLSVYLTMLGFRESWFEGLAWLLVLGPALLLALCIAARIALEFLISIFHLALHVEDVTAATRRIEGQTGEIHSDLPRIRFWRSWTTQRNNDGGD